MLAMYASRPGPDRDTKAIAERVAKARKLRAESDPVAVSKARAKPGKASRSLASYVWRKELGIPNP
jgi:hypothetical protein